MDIIGSRKFLEIAGDRTHELPPLLVADLALSARRLEKLLTMATELVESESLIPLTTAICRDEIDLERRRYELALQFSEQYLGLKTHWKWGDSVLEWILLPDTTTSFKALIFSSIPTSVVTSLPEVTNTFGNITSL